jgi:hypothetical protein
MPAERVACTISVGSSLQTTLKRSTSDIQVGPEFKYELGPNHLKQAMKNTAEMA